MLIAGCSHTAGSEIDGTSDSTINRQLSFGNQLANIMGFNVVNIADPGSPNSAIARSVLDWINMHYDENSMELFPVICWSESSRMEVPSDRPHWYEEINTNSDWYSITSRDYWRFNLGWKGSDPEEKEMIPMYHRFMAENEVYLEILSANLVLQLQYFFKSLKLNYVMSNSMHMFSDDLHLDFYLNLIDTTKYMHLRDNSQSFYWKYKNMGFENPKAKYWHHSEIPHRMYAEELYKFIKGQ